VAILDLGDRLDFMMASLSGIETITEEGEEGEIEEEAEGEGVITSMKEEEDMEMIMEVIDEEGEEEVAGIEMMMDTEEVEIEEEKEVVVGGRVVKKDELELHHGMQQWVMVMELLLCHHHLARHLHLPRPLIEPFMYVYSIIIIVNVILCCSFLKRKLHQCVHTII